MTTAEQLINSIGDKPKVNIYQVSQNIRKQDIAQYAASEKLRKGELKMTPKGRQQLAYQKAYESRSIKQKLAGPSIYRAPKVKPSISKVVSGLAGAILPSGSMGGSYSSGSSSSGRGRGRPVQTFKYQIPGVGPVPIQAYKRWLTQAKAQQRLQYELAKVKMAGMQPSPQEMPMGYGQYDAEDQFLDQQQPMQMPIDPYAQQMQMQGMSSQSQPGALRRGLTNLGNRFMGSMFGTQEPGMVNAPPMSAGTYPTRRISMWGSGVGVGQGRNILNTSGNILNTPNIFNRPGDATIAVRRNIRPYAY